MHQFLLPDTYDGESSFRLTGKDYHYICNVLRLNSGAVFKGMDKKSRIYSVRIKDVQKDCCMLELSCNTVERGYSCPYEISLFQCLPKGQKMDLIVRQATEAGVSRIIPVLSEHSVIRLKTGQDKSNKQCRWERIAREAVQQSESPVCPQVFSPVGFNEVGKYIEGESVKIFFHQERLDNISLHGCLKNKPASIALFIGPEGGLSSKETDYLMSLGFVPVFLGNNILRSETAAIYAVACVRIILQENTEWTMNK